MIRFYNEESFDAFKTLIWNITLPKSNSFIFAGNKFPDFDLNSVENFECFIFRDNFEYFNIDD